MAKIRVGCPQIEQKRTSEKRMQIAQITVQIRQRKVGRFHRFNKPGVYRRGRRVFPSKRDSPSPRFRWFYKRRGPEIRSSFNNFDPTIDGQGIELLSQTARPSDAGSHRSLSSRQAKKQFLRVLREKS